MISSQRIRSVALPREEGDESLLEIDSPDPRDSESGPPDSPGPPESACADAGPAHPGPPLTGPEEPGPPPATRHPRRGGDRGLEHRRRAREEELAVGQHEHALGVALGLGDVVGREDDAGPAVGQAP